jgi:hypothetical protein
MKPLKFPIRSTLAVFALTGLLALYIPLPQIGASPDVMSKIFR